jgi:hypothetical protein
VGLYPDEILGLLSSPPLVVLFPMVPPETVYLLPLLVGYRE